MSNPLDLGQSPPEIRCPACGLRFGDLRAAEQHVSASKKCAASIRLYAMKTVGPGSVSGRYPTLADIARGAAKPMTATEAMNSTPPAENLNLDSVRYEFEMRMREMAESYSRQLQPLQEKIKGLEKSLASYSFDPKWNRSVKEATDYTKVFDEVEDGLEEDYRGWPKIKSRVIF